MTEEVEYTWCARAEFSEDAPQVLDCNGQSVYFHFDFGSTCCSDCGQPAPSGAAYWDSENTTPYVICEDCEYIYDLLRILDW